MLYGWSFGVEWSAAWSAAWRDCLDIPWGYDHTESMATATVRSTYSLDLDTVRRLEDLAKQWNTSKSGALRRAIKVASEQARPASNEKLEALDELRRLLALDADSAAEWCREVEQERAAWERRMSRQSR